MQINLDYVCALDQYNFEVWNQLERGLRQCLRGDRRALVWSYECSSSGSGGEDGGEDGGEEEEGGSADPAQSVSGDSDRPLE